MFMCGTTFFWSAATWSYHEITCFCWPVGCLCSEIKYLCSEIICSVRRITGECRKRPERCRSTYGGHYVPRWWIGCLCSGIPLHTGSDGVVDRCCRRGARIHSVPIITGIRKWISRAWWNIFDFWWILCFPGGEGMRGGGGGSHSRFSRSFLFRRVRNCIFCFFNIFGCFFLYFLVLARVREFCTKTGAHLFEAEALNV